jgi:putative ABC transport system ATP-binding protein
MIRKDPGDGFRAEDSVRQNHNRLNDLKAYLTPRQRSSDGKLGVSRVMVKRTLSPENPLVAENITRTHRMGTVEVTALRGVSLTVRAGDFVAIAGSSGSGKSTLLNILGCVDTPNEGKVYVDGFDTGALPPQTLSTLRAKKIGFIFQTFNLLPTLSAVENVEYPLMLLGLSRTERRDQAREALVRVGLEKQLKHRPSQMSGGQRQRVAIARAMVKHPKIILADEPTANLDRKNFYAIMDLMLRLNQEEKMTFLFATHDQDILRMVKRVIHLSDGRVVTDDNSTPEVASPVEEKQCA